MRTAEEVRAIMKENQDRVDRHEREILLEVERKRRRYADVVRERLKGNLEYFDSRILEEAEKGNTQLRVCIPADVQYSDIFCEIIESSLIANGYKAYHIVISPKTTEIVVDWQIRKREE